MNKYGIFVLLMQLSLLLAGEYGSIAGVGKVNDNDFIRPLTPAQIIVVEADIRVETNEFGEYIIPHVRAGKYTITVQWRDEQLSFRNVNVAAGITSTVDLHMRYDLLSLPCFAGSVTEQTLNASKTYNGRKVTSYDIKRSPATTIAELIQKLPGIVTSDYGLHLRGSTSDDITYYVDGLILMWPYTTGWQPAPLPLSAIEELSLLSNGIDAEYGEMRAGIVNIVTRQAGKQHAAKIDYSTDRLFPADRLNFGYNKYAVSASGPLHANLGYFLAGDLLFTDAFQQAKYRIASPRNDYHGFGKLTYQLPNGRGQLSLSGFRAREQWIRWSPYIEPGNTFKYFDQRPMTRTKYWFGIAALDCRISSRNLTSLRIGIDHFDCCYGNRDYAWEEDNSHKWYDDYRFKAEHLIPYLLDEQWQQQNSITIRDLLVDSMMAYHTEGFNMALLALRDNPWGVQGLFYTYGDYRAWSYSQHSNFQAHLSMDQQITEYYTLNSGIHFIKYDNRYYNNPLAWSDAPLWDYYHWEPYRIDGYLQNSITYKNVSTKAGLRLDYFNPNSEPLIDTLSIPDTTESESSLRISPRLGIHLLLRDRLRLGFGYEHYLREYHKYTPMWPMTYRTTVYGLSAEYGIMHNTGVGCDFYYRRYDDWMQITNNEYEYNLYGDSEYEDYIGVIGVQFNLSSQPIEYLMLDIAYNVQYAYGSNTDWWHNYYYYQPQDLPEVVPADFDERHQLRVAAHLDLPSHRSLKLFKSFSSSLFLTLFSGQPYTPLDLRGNQVDNKNAARIPGYWNVDWKLARRFRIGPTNLVLSAVLLNLFNTRQVIDVYQTTGDPDDRGDPLPSLEQFMYTPMNNSAYSPQSDFNHDGLITPVEARDAYTGALTDLYMDPTNYASPFQIRIGIGVEF